jgi:hypothetical protein
MEIDYYYVNLFSKMSYNHRAAVNKLDCFGENEIKTVFLHSFSSLQVPCGNGKDLEETPPLFERYAGVYNGIISSLSLVCLLFASSANT